MVFLAILGLFLSLPAHAIVGEGVELPDPALYPYACRLNVFYKSGYNGSCSATIVNEYQILTSAHCFRPKMELGREYTLAIQCSNEFLSDPMKVSIPKGITVPMDKNTGEWPVPTNRDLAILEFKNDLNRPFLKRASSPELYFDSTGWIREKEGVRCSIMGYGQNSSHSNSGKLQSASLDQTNIRWTKEIGIKVFSKAYYLPVAASHGDSGGTLMCQAPGHEPELVGVTSQIGLEAVKEPGKWVANYFFPAWIADHELF